MDYKKTKASHEAITRDIHKYDELTGNIYETLVVLSKRSNQIASTLRQELTTKIQEFSTNSIVNDGVDEIYENREQIELARYYEQIPKATLIAVHELEEDKLCFRRAEEEKEAEY